MLIEKKGHKSFSISEIVNGYLFTVNFLYYNKQQAVKLFKKQVKKLKV